MKWSKGQRPSEETKRRAYQSLAADNMCHGTSRALHIPDITCAYAVHTLVT